MASPNLTEDQIEQRLSQLTPGERTALYWRSRGMTIGEIKVAMGVDEEMVTLHLAHVYQKLGLGGLTDFQRGLVLGSDLGSVLSRHASGPEGELRDVENSTPEPVEPRRPPDSSIRALVKADDVSLSTLPAHAQALRRPVSPLSESIEDSTGWRLLFRLSRHVRTLSAIVFVAVVIFLVALFVIPSFQRTIFRNVNRGVALAGGRLVPLPATSAPGQTVGSPLTPRVYAGRHSGALGDIALTLSPTKSKIELISVSFLGCGGEANNDQHTFTVDLNPSIAIIGGRFSAQAVPVSSLTLPDHAHSFDIDGVFFDANGDGGREQSLGGISFVSGAARCNVQWVATAVAPDSDRDGWSDAAERRLGSDPSDAGSTPQSWMVPTTALYGPDVCHDFIGNSGDQLIDQSDPNCAGHA